MTDDLVPSGLKCEFRNDPLGIDATHPRLTWLLSSAVRGQRPTAFRILVARSPRELQAGKGTLWDSGLVRSEQLSAIYAGKPLSSESECYWKVQTWGITQTSAPFKTPGPWSTQGFWSMGLLHPSDWSAQWITDPVLAKPENRPRTPIYCYRSQLSSDPNVPKSVTLDLGAPKTFDQAVLAPARPEGLTWDIRSVQFPRRFRLVAANTPSFEGGKVLLDQTHADFPDPRRNTCEFKLTPTTARYVRLEVTRLGTWDAHQFGVFLAQFTLLFGAQNVSAGAAVSASDSVENDRWSTKYLTDGHPHVEFSPFPAPLDPKFPGAFSPSRVTMLRRDFTLPSGVKRATLYSTARGFYEPRLNGQRVTNDLLAPGFTDYHKRQSYQTYDVTRMLHAGPNTLGAVLGYGWYAGHMNLGGNGYIYGFFPQFACQLNIEFTNGRKLTISTDQRWRTSLDGPLRWSDILDGEASDLRKAQPGWDRPGFNASRWNPAWSQPLGPDEFGPETLVTERNVPVRAIQPMTPVSQKQVRPGVWSFDLGQEITGWVRIKTHGGEKAGTHIVVRHSEAIQPNGELNLVSLMGTLQRDDYVLAGKGPHSLEPHFTYHGFRYFEVSGLTAPPQVGDIVAINIHTAVEEVGTFESSNPNFNRLMTASKWTERNMLFDVPAGCAGRSERLAWNGDIRPCVQTAFFHFDMAAFFEKYALDIQDDQKADGRFTDISPHAHLAGSDICVGSPGWADAGVSLPWEAYVNTGDVQLLAQHYESAKRWVDYIHQQNPSLIWMNARGMDWGDWLSAGRATPKELGSTAFFAHSTDLLARMAEVLGKAQDAAHYSALFAKIKAAFAARYVSPEGVIQMPVVNPKVDNRVADVNLSVDKLIVDGRLRFTVNTDSLQADPAPNVLKTLHLKYRVGDRVLTQSFKEDAKVDLTTDEILEATFAPSPQADEDVQGSYALALHFGLLDEPVRTKAIQRLLSILSRDGNHPTTGFWSSVELLLALSDCGQNQSAAQLANLTTYPSWGYMLSNGGTTFWEAFDADKQALSYNHWTHSACGEWLWRNVAGLNPDPTLPGYRGFTVRPRPSSLVSSCKATCRSVRGPIRINWRVVSGQFVMDLEVPPGAMAKVYIPGDVSTVCESNQPIYKVRGIHTWKVVDGTPIYMAASGVYHITARYRG